MGFNKNTWTKDYTGAAGLRTLTKQDAALRKRREKEQKDKEKSK